MLQINQHNNNYTNLEIQTQVPLRDKNWFKTGGPARYYCEPSDEYQFQQALTYARDNALNIFMLGEGANILISDDAFYALVIRPLNNSIEIVENNPESNHVLVKEDAGTSLDSLIEWCFDNSLQGLEEFSGIPGTVGGAVFINLHYFEFLLSDFVVSARIIEKTSGTITTVDASWFNFGYDDSRLFDQHYYLIDATFKVKRANELEIAFARGRKVEIIRHRRARYPYEMTCGSFFRNFHKEEVVHETSGSQLIFVAYYLDKIGVKGSLTSGDAIVSHKHANMIVNKGNATSTDIINLARMMQQKVFEQFNITPHAECQLIGFKDNPLL